MATGVRFGPLEPNLESTGIADPPAPTVESRDAPSDAETSAAAIAGGRRWRREYSILVLVGLFLSILAFLFFFLDVDLNQLKRFGYLGIFLISLVGSASVALPLPGAAVVVGSGQFVDDIGGIPFFLIVGVVASLGETIGELTGYLAGMGGKVMIEDRPIYDRLDRWMRRHGITTMFVLSVVPNPVFDVGGFLAGAVRMPVWHFLLTVFIGKLIKNSMLALLGDVGVDAVIGRFD